MANLKFKSEPDNYFSYLENWVLDNNLSATVFFEKETCSIIISSKSGDVSDQIYEILKKKELFKEIKLLVTMTYLIAIEESLVHQFIKQVELIDSESLKEGKSY